MNTQHHQRAAVRAAPTPSCSLNHHAPVLSPVGQVGASWRVGAALGEQAAGAVAHLVAPAVRLRIDGVAKIEAGDTLLLGFSNTPLHLQAASGVAAHRSV